MQTKPIHINYQKDAENIKLFLTEFEDNNLPYHPVHYKKKYMIQLQNISDKLTERLEVFLQDLQYFFKQENHEGFLNLIEKNTKRYQSLFNEVIIKNDLLPPMLKQLSRDQEQLKNMDQALRQHRKQNYQKSKQTQIIGKKQRFPVKLLLDFNTYIIRGQNAKQKILTIKKLGGQLIGNLITVKAIVIRITQVKPLMVVSCYTCDICGCQNYQVVDGKNYTPLTQCSSKQCKQKRIRGKLNHQPGFSKMISYQEIKIQQTPDQLSQGNVPRTFTIQARGDNVRKCSPGDTIIVQGVLLPKQINRRRIQNTYIESYLQAYKIYQTKKKYVQLFLTQTIKNHVMQIRSMLTQNDIYNKLSHSIAPGIFGLNNVKKALLLLMISAPTITLNDGMKIRGDINIALIGDPGIAKSQLLKRVSYLAPRGIYTSGKGSTGVGLTAAVLRDPVSKQVSLQAGALVIADMGICCIDEFDKMDQNDRTSIHEVMQQQTVSIAKAGIVASLNARTSILAAANPYYGRFNMKKSLEQNLKLPAALLSRFDLIFLMLDKTDDDEEMGRFILQSHKGQTFTEQTFDDQFTRSYISMAKSFNPIISQTLKQNIVGKYIQMRTASDSSKDSRVTLRKLLAIIRLAIAKARLRFSEQVSYQDFDEAIRLVQECNKGLSTTQTGTSQNLQNFQRIYRVIKENCMRTQDQTVIRNQIFEKVNLINSQEIYMELL